MAVGGVLGFVNCSTRPNLKIVKTEIDLNPCIEFWEKSNFGHFAIFRLFFLIHFLMYFLRYFLMCFLIPVYVCIVCRSKFISQLLRMTRQFRMTPRQNHNCTNHYHQTLRNHFPTPIQIPTPILHHIQYLLSAPGNEFTLPVHFNASSTGYVRDIPVLLCAPQTLQHKTINNFNVTQLLFKFSKRFG